MFLLIFSSQMVPAQESPATERYGQTLNIGIGVGYYNYIGRSIGASMINYEFDVVKNFTLAPFIGIYTYRKHYYWGNPNKPYNDPSYRNYVYREVVVPIGVKGTYYLDKLLRARNKWDFYVAGSIGFAYKKVIWENDYYGNEDVYRSASPLYLDVHLGAEYHLNQKAGLFLDLSTGVSTIGLALHF